MITLIQKIGTADFIKENGGFKTTNMSVSFWLFGYSQQEKLEKYLEIVYFFSGKTWINDISLH